MCCIWPYFPTLVYTPHSYTHMPVSHTRIHTYLYTCTQSLSEKLFTRIQSGGLRYETRLLLLTLLSRIVGMHKLLLLNLYPYMQKYIQPHQKDANTILAALVQVCGWVCWCWCVSAGVCVGVWITPCLSPCATLFHIQYSTCNVPHAMFHIQYPPYHHICQHTHPLSFPPTPATTPPPHRPHTTASPPKSSPPSSASSVTNLYTMQHDQKPSRLD